MTIVLLECVAESRAIEVEYRYRRLGYMLSPGNAGAVVCGRKMGRDETGAFFLSFGKG